MTSDTPSSSTNSHEPLLLSGKPIAAAVGRTSRSRALAITEKIGRKPGLAVILVGENAASKTYVASKTKTALETGLEVYDTHLPASVSENELSSVIEALNNDDRVDGILLQLPLPAPLVGEKFLPLIAPEKDADGLHPLNQGLLMQGAPAPRPCTPLGSMVLIDIAMSRSVIDETTEISSIPRTSLAGKKAVVIGRSQLVGKPIAFLLLERNATVTIAHSKSPDLPSICREADIVVAAVGVPNLVKRDWVKPGAIVIDVGINRLESGALTGDVDFTELTSVCSAITPVPGGVGPMTVAMLISNTVENCYRRNTIPLGE